MIWLPIAAWMATSNICRGMSFCSVSTSSRPRFWARMRWTIIESASTRSPLISTSTRTSGEGSKRSK
jgi:hypothetical protein